MIIWRNLDPKRLGELLVTMAEVFAAKRKTRRKQATPAQPFRGAGVVNPALRRSRPRDRS